MKLVVILAVIVCIFGCKQKKSTGSSSDKAHKEDSTTELKEAAKAEVESGKTPSDTAVVNSLDDFSEVTVLKYRRRFEIEFVPSKSMLPVVAKWFRASGDTYMKKDGPVFSIPTSHSKFYSFFGKDLVTTMVDDCVESEPLGICYDDAAMTFYGSKLPTALVVAGESHLDENPSDPIFSTTKFSAGKRLKFDANVKRKFSRLTCITDWKGYEPKVADNCQSLPVDFQDGPCAIPCWLNGYCERVDEKCVARSHEKCENSLACSTHARCTWAHDRCVATPNSCIEHKLCKSIDQCNTNSGRCRAISKSAKTGRLP